jgi:uroporphyrinogen decarboxylase
MTSRERVLAAIEHKPVDRVPRIFKGTPEVDERLVRELGLTCADDLKEYFKCENLHWPFYRVSAPDPNELMEIDRQEISRWGIRYREVDYGNGRYFEPIGSPLMQAQSVEDIEQYPWPDPNAVDLSSVKKQLELWKDKPTGGPGISIFEVAYQMRGMEQFLVDMLVDPDMVEAILRHIEEYWTILNQRIWEAGEGKFDIFLAGDDFGSQRSLIMSKSHWDRFFAPIYKRAFGWAKERGMRIMIHSDGAIREIIPNLINFGLDVLDPAQPMAEGMDPYEIKREFGRDLCIHGTIDVQELLPFGTPAKVKDEVKRQIEILGKDSGFILAPSHCIQPGVPTENIKAIYEAADEMS